MNTHIWNLYADTEAYDQYMDVLKYISTGGIEALHKVHNAANSKLNASGES